MPKTELRNPRSTHIDRMDTRSMLELINDENLNAVRAVGAALPEIARAADAIAASFENGGRLFYIGAGTSGRLAVIDAAECAPTYGVAPELVQASLAGGPACMTRASEAAEDDGDEGVRDLLAREPRAGDVLVGISASGSARYVTQAVAKARALGLVTVSLTCAEGSALSRAADINILTDTGPEVVTGSTRMKAGTAQKLVLNMLSTAAMVKTGKVYENLMINLKPSNEKLRRRMISIVQEIADVDEAAAISRLDAAQWDIRAAVE